jgi:hypothetical protein
MEILRLIAVLLTKSKQKIEIAPPISEKVAPKFEMLQFVTKKMKL